MLRFRRSIRGCLAALLVAIAWTVVPAAGAKDLYPSSSSPSRVILNPSENPATSQAFAWRTDAATMTGQVEVTTPEGVPVRSAASSVGTEITFPFPGETWAASYSSRHHETTVEGLTPDTPYRYRVGSPAGWSPWYEFRTAATGPTDWRMLYFGDVQTSILSYSDLVMERAYEAVPDARLALHAGDLINDSEQDYQWGEWFEILDGHSQRMVTVPLMGNHELHGDDEALQFHEHFNNPENGPEGYKESAFHFDYQGVRFLILNSNKDWAPDQAAYVRSVLENNPNKWTVVSFHHPIFSASWNDRDNKSVRDAWLPLLEEFNVDLVLQGHDHIYSRGHVAANQVSETEQRGPVYVISMAGEKQYPAPLPGSGVDNWTPNGGVAVKTEPYLATFQDIEFDGDYLRYNAVVARHGGVIRNDFKVGDSLDSFTVIKEDGKEKRVLEGLHYAPEPEPEPAGKLKVLSVRKAGKPGVIRIRARVTAPGRVSARGKLRAGKIQAGVSASKAAKRAGVVILTVKPGASAMKKLRKLRRGKKISGKVTVTYRPDATGKVQRSVRKVSFRR